MTGKKVLKKNTGLYTIREEDTLDNILEMNPHLLYKKNLEAELCDDDKEAAVMVELAEKKKKGKGKVDMKPDWTKAASFVTMEQTYEH